MHGTAPRAAHASPRLPSLTSLRWFAASIVFLRHSGPLLNDTSVASTYLYIQPQGATGVSFFFILSGFVLAWTYRPGEPARRFYRRRVARVVPAYLAALAVGLAYIVVFQHARGTTFILEAIFPATLLQSWVPSSEIYFGNSDVSWSLSTEVFFYAVFPLLIVPIARMRRAGLIRLVVIAAAASIALPLMLRPELVGEGFGFWAIYINPMYRLAEFVIGLCLCGLIVHGVRLRIPLSLAVGVTVVAYLVAGQVPIYAMWVAVTVIPFALLIFAFAQADLAGRTTVLHHPVLIRLGQWSFAFYLLHTFVTGVAQKIVGASPSTAWHVAVWLGSYAVAIVAAYLMFRFVEHPLERRIRRGGTAVPEAEWQTSPATG